MRRSEDVFRISHSPYAEADSAWNTETGPLDLIGAVASRTDSQAGMILSLKARELRYS